MTKNVRVKFHRHLKRRHRRYVVLGGIILASSAIIFGLEMSGLGAATGVVGTIFVVLSDI